MDDINTTFFEDCLLNLNDPNEDVFLLTAKGLDVLYGILEHFAYGGTIDNHPEWDEDYITMFLALAFSETRRHVEHTDQLFPPEEA